jgi:hypothetical protein
MSVRLFSLDHFLQSMELREISSLCNPLRATRAPRHEATYWTNSPDDRLEPALFLLLIAALMAFSGTFAAQPAFAASGHFILYLMLAIGPFYAVLTVWAILTVIGILRLRQWGRYSILIIGGGLTAINLVTVIFTILSRAVLSELTPHKSAVDPHITSVITAFMVVLNLLFAAIDIWWLIYFNLRSTRDLFQMPTLATADPYGQPLPTASLPVKSYDGFFSSPERAPAAIKILGWLLLVSAVCCLPMTLLPFPAFILGFIVPVKASHFLYFAILIIAACIGYGLLKLRNSARFALIAFALFGIFNMAVALLPWAQNHLREYTAQIMAQFTTMLPTIPGQTNATYTNPMEMVVFNSMVESPSTSTFFGWTTGIAPFSQHRRLCPNSFKTTSQPALGRPVPPQYFHHLTVFTQRYQCSLGLRSPIKPHIYIKHILPRTPGHGS